MSGRWSVSCGSRMWVERRAQLNQSVSDRHDIMGASIVGHNKGDGHSKTQSQFRNRTKPLAKLSCESNS